MKSQWFLGAVTLAAGLVLGFGPAMAQTATLTPSSTPTPTQGSCSLTLPGGGTPACDTGASTPPSFLGISGGNFNNVATDKSGATSCSTGTFGALVQDSNAKQYVLSSNHVLARNSSTHGSASVNELIVQPGLVDLGCWQDTSDTVAQLTKWTSLSFGKGTNQMDAAIARVVNANQGPAGPSVPGVDPEGKILNIGKISTTPFIFNNLLDGMNVIKMGRSSCLTSGRIDAFDAMGTVVYPAGANVAASGNAIFNHQILVFGAAIGSTSGAGCSFAAQGDSGALVLTDDFTCPQAVGMLFAAAAGTSFGPESGGQIVAVTPIQTILNRFKVTLVGDSQCTPGFMTQQISAPSTPEISAELRASIEMVRKVKENHAPKLLRNREVVAVGIGTGDDSASATLNVYLQTDTPKIRSKVLSEVRNVQVRFKHAQKFKAL
jgi:hypothetical protein